MLHPSHCFRTCHRVARSMLGFCRYAALTSRRPRHVALVGPSPVQRHVEVHASAGRRSNSSKEPAKPTKQPLPATFQQLGVPPPLLEALAAANITVPTEIQALALPALAAGGDYLLASHTGSGKTLAYLLPLVAQLKAAEAAAAAAAAETDVADAAAAGVVAGRAGGLGAGEGVGAAAAEEEMADETATAAAAEQGNLLEVQLEGEDSSSSSSSSASSSGRDRDSSSRDRDRDSGNVGGLSRPRRPRLLVLGPTKELTTQIGAVAKQLSHHAKFRAVCVSAATRMPLQKRALAGPIDLLVATPTRLLQHAEAGNVALGDVVALVIDEADTMFDQGFGAEITRLLKALKNKPQPAQVILVSATMTKAVGRLVEAQLPGVTRLQGAGFHRGVAAARHTFSSVPPGRDKLDLLTEIVSRDAAKGSKVLVFCGSVDSARAAHHHLADRDLGAVCYHGDMPIPARKEALAAFAGANPGAEGVASIMVASDLAARGLDFPGTIDHVVNFDFPVNPIDYLHRAGRTARGGAAGKVTSLVAKRDKVLAQRIEWALAHNEPLDQLSSQKEVLPPSQRIKPQAPLRATAGAAAAGKQRGSSSRGGSSSSSSSGKREAVGAGPGRRGAARFAAAAPEGGHGSSSGSSRGGSSSSSRGAEGGRGGGRGGGGGGRGAGGPAGARRGSSSGAGVRGGSRK